MLCTKTKYFSLSKEIQIASTDTTYFKALTSDPGITAAALCQDFPEQVVAGAAPMVMTPLHGKPQSLTTRLAGVGMAHHTLTHTHIHTHSCRGYPCCCNSKEVCGEPQTNPKKKGKVLRSDKGIIYCPDIQPLVVTLQGIIESAAVKSTAQALCFSSLALLK